MAVSLLQVYGNPTLPKYLSPNWSHPSVYFRPPVIVMAQSRSYWASIDAEIEDHLKRVIPVKQPLSVFEPLDHFVFSAPRNTAPALCIAACELVGGHRDQAMAAASALHLIHAAAYTREYPPLVGSSSTVVTHHRAYGPNIQLLAGVGIAPIGFELLAGSDDRSEEISERVLRVMVEMSRAMGSEGWIGGQYRGLEVNGSAGEESLVDKVSERKEGGLHACGGACGAILGGGSEEDIEKLRKYGRLVGMVKGLSKNLFGGKENEVRKKIEELKILALKELESFNAETVHQIYSFLDFEGL